MDIRNLIDYRVEHEVAYVLTQEKIVQDLSTNLVPEDEVEADDNQESIPAKATEAMQCASLLQQFWMQQDIVDHEMLASIQTVKDKISIMKSSKLVQKPISEYFSKV
jgi:predicted CoA-binding protein